MSQVEIDRVLAQIRSISQAARPNGAAPTAPTAADSGFANMLKQGIARVNETQTKATTLAAQFERGVPGVELPQVMLEMQKANVSFRALAEVRNKFVDAYREIMNMPL